MSDYDYSRITTSKQTLMRWNKMYVIIKNRGAPRPGDYIDEEAYNVKRENTMKSPRDELFPVSSDEKYSKFRENKSWPAIASFSVLIGDEQPWGAIHPEHEPEIRIDERLREILIVSRGNTICLTILSNNIASCVCQYEARRIAVIHIKWNCAAWKWMSRNSPMRSNWISRREVPNKIMKCSNVTWWATKSSKAICILDQMTNIDNSPCWSDIENVVNDLLIFSTQTFSKLNWRRLVHVF